MSELLTNQLPPFIPERRSDDISPVQDDPFSKIDAELNITDFEVVLEKTPYNIVIAGYLPELRDGDTPEQIESRRIAEEILEIQLSKLSEISDHYQITYVANGACAADVMSKVDSFNQKNGSNFNIMATPDFEYENADGQTVTHAMKGKDAAVLHFMEQYRLAQPDSFAETSLTIMDSDTYPEDPHAWIEQIAEKLIFQDSMNRENGAVVLTGNIYDAGDTNTLYKAQEALRTKAVSALQRVVEMKDRKAQSAEYNKHYGAGESYTVGFSEDAYLKELDRWKVVIEKPMLQIWSGEDQHRIYKAMYAKLGELALSSKFAVRSTVVKDKDARVITDARGGKINLDEYTKALNPLKFDQEVSEEDGSRRSKVARLMGKISTARVVFANPLKIWDDMSSEKYDSQSLGRTFLGVDTVTGQEIYSDGLGPTAELALAA